MFFWYFAFVFCVFFSVQLLLYFKFFLRVALLFCVFFCGQVAPLFLCFFCALLLYFVLFLMFWKEEKVRARAHAFVYGKLLIFFY